ncbi:DUF2255 family protein [Streptomyces xylophagus]|uniref:DUF2255 family protein n=1 Tax=Streptomyces xylophagus TaxID=285514 RepID=UPI0005BD1D1D|nr:DUF2255 family protein [Streptomyces xylophagus]
MTTTAPWTDDELDRVGAAEELDVASRRPDGKLSSRRTIWVVRVGDDIYVRSVNGPTSAWFRGTRVRHEGRVEAGGVEKDVAFEDVDGEINDVVDAAYRSKYGRYSAHTIQRITSSTAGSTTMRLLPR